MGLLKKVCSSLKGNMLLLLKYKSRSHFSKHKRDPSKMAFTKLRKLGNSSSNIYMLYLILVMNSRADCFIFIFPVCSLVPLERCLLWSRYGKWCIRERSLLPPPEDNPLTAMYFSNYRNLNENLQCQIKDTLILLLA